MFESRILQSAWAIPSHIIVSDHNLRYQTIVPSPSNSYPWKGEAKAEIRDIFVGECPLVQVVEWHMLFNLDELTSTKGKRLCAYICVGVWLGERGSPYTTTLAVA